MSRATKRKHVLREMWEDDFRPPAENQQIVKILCSKGNNLHEVQTPEGEEFLVSMPNKFRRNIWVKRGQYVIVEPIKEGNKVKAEIVRILTSQHIKTYHKDNIWPSAFEEAIENKNAYEHQDESKYEKSESETDSDSYVELFVNPNRPYVNFNSEVESSSESEDCVNERGEVGDSVNENGSDIKYKNDKDSHEKDIKHENCEVKNKEEKE